MNNITLNDKQAAALQQGKAFQKAVQMMKKIVNTSAQIETDEYIITLAAEEAEGLYTPSAPDHLNWQIPQP
ncbi:MAG: hypothetical protein KDD43_17040, partial [Bdellovibrionales bacterium]|nr:hypothetical protein [Bdellovibrionales bacterium]